MWRVSQFHRVAGGLISTIMPEEPLLLAFPIPFLHRLALVVHLLAASQRQLDLGPAAAVEIDRQRNERQSVALYRPLQLGDFAVLEQQFPRAARLVVQAVAVAVFGDVAVDQPDFGTIDGRIALRN